MNNQPTKAWIANKIKGGSTIVVRRYFDTEEIESQAEVLVAEVMFLITAIMMFLIPILTKILVLTATQYIHTQYHIIRYILNLLALQFTNI